MNSNVRASQSKPHGVPDFTLATVHFAPWMVQLDVRGLKLFWLPPQNGLLLAVDREEIENTMLLFPELNFFLRHQEAGGWWLCGEGEALQTSF